MASIQEAAAAYAQQHQGYSAHAVMQEGTVTYRNGVPGVMVKYNTPQGSSTEWTPYEGPKVGAGDIGGGGGGGAGGGGMSGGAYYEQMKSMLGAQGIAERASTKAAIQQALIGYGLIPEGFEDKLGALDDTTRALIQKNTDTGISGYARLLESKQDAMKSLLAGLSQRGMRRSGTKGYKLRRGQLDWDRQFQDSLRGLLGDIGNKYSTYAGNEGGRQQQLLSALWQSMNTFSGGPSSYSSSGDTSSAASQPAASQAATPWTGGSGTQADPYRSTGSSGQVTKWY